MASTGFVLIDSRFRPVYADPESIKILGFPNTVSIPASLDGILTQRVISLLPPERRIFQGSSITQFLSGRRRYLCRIFVLENHWDGNPREARIALLLERGLPGPPAGARKQRTLAGMCEDPFSFSPDPKYCTFSRAHQEVFTSVRTMVREGRGIGVIVAQAGMGKTILLGCLAENLRNESEIAVFPSSFESPAELVRAVMAALGVSGPGYDLSRNLRRFEDWLLAKNSAGQRVLLICDDAQDYSLDTLENLCLLSDLRAGNRKLLQIVMAGRQWLLEKLNDSRLEMIGDRINVFCRLGPLDEAEVHNYVLHRLRIAGCSRQLFSSAALSSIALYSRGIPLNINMICRHCLSLAAAINLQMVDEKVVADSAYDLVLRAQPAGFWDDPPDPSFTQSRRAGQLRDRHGLRLVKK